MTEQEIRQQFPDAIDRLDGDVALLCEMAAMTAPDCPEVLDQIEKALSDEEVEQAARSLHKLKGMLSTFHTEGVVLEIQEMLEHARHERVEQVIDLFERQKSRLTDAIDQVGELADSLDAINGR